MVTFWGALTPKNFYKPVVSCLEEGRGVAQREREKITCAGLSYIGLYHSFGRERKKGDLGFGFVRTRYCLVKVGPRPRRVLSRILSAR